MSSKQQLGVENRRHKRYRQSGEVQIVQVGSTSTYRGYVIDLSEGGCMLGLCAPSGLEAGMAVEVSIHLACTAFRAVASVRHVSENRCRIGISFADIGRRARSELLNLIAELEETKQIEGPVPNPCKG